MRSPAEDILSAQNGQIATMKGLADDMHSMRMHDSGSMGMSEHAMGMNMDMEALEEAKPFDRAFTDAMVPHHEGAIAVARAELGEGAHPALRDTANDIIAAQTQEIAQMKRWREAWYGSATVPMSGHHGPDDDMDVGG